MSKTLKSDKTYSESIAEIKKSKYAQIDAYVNKHDKKLSEIKQTFFDMDADIMNAYENGSVSTEETIIEYKNIYKEQKREEKGEEIRHSIKLVNTDINASISKVFMYKEHYKKSMNNVDPYYIGNASENAAKNKEMMRLSAKFIDEVASIGVTCLDDIRSDLATLFKNFRWESKSICYPDAELGYAAPKDAEKTYKNYSEIVYACTNASENFISELDGLFKDAMDNIRIIENRTLDRVAEEIDVLKNSADGLANMLNAIAANGSEIIKKNSQILLRFCDRFVDRIMTAVDYKKEE